jgi:hypothetical protein
LDELVVVGLVQNELCRMQIFNAIDEENEQRGYEADRT